MRYSQDVIEQGSGTYYVISFNYVGPNTQNLKRRPKSTSAMGSNI